MQSDHEIISKCDLQLIKYVLYILDNSRTKKHAKNRLEGLLTYRLQKESNCTTYTDEMIKDYLSGEEKKIKEQIPTLTLGDAMIKKLKIRTHQVKKEPTKYIVSFDDEDFAEFYTIASAEKFMLSRLCRQMINELELEQIAVPE